MADQERHGEVMYRTLLLTYLRPQWRRALLLAALLLASIGLELANPQILRLFIDTARAGGALGTLSIVAAIFLLVALLTGGVAVAETYVAENVGWTATNRLRADLALHCLLLDPSFHNEHTPGELIERIDGDVATLGTFFSRFVVHVLANVLLFIGVLALLYRVDWRVGAVLSLYAFVALGIITGLRSLAVPHWTAARQSSAALIGFLDERLAGTEDIRANGATAYVMRASYRLARELLHSTRRAGVVGMAPGGATVMLLTLGTVISLALGAYLFGQRAISLGTVYLIFAYTELLRRPLEQITRQMQDLQQATAGISRIQGLLNTRAAITDGPGAALPPGAPAVEFDRVTFGYAAGDPVFRDLSFSLRPGEVLGVLGRTGSGKTTLTRLLFRLYDPAHGAVRLDNVDLRDLRLVDLRGRVGMVTQDIHLFHATVRDNLTLFDRAIPDEKIMRALDELGLGEWYRALPRGLETMLDSGGGLSAGEAQLLAFTRVFLTDPGLVILDEASSRLDPATERRLERAVDRLLHGRTGIIIAHRLPTVLRADSIMILRDGRIGEYGPRDALARDPRSRFAGLLRTGLEEVLV